MPLPPRHETLSAAMERALVELRLWLGVRCGPGWSVTFTSDAATAFRHTRRSYYALVTPRAGAMMSRYFLGRVDQRVPDMPRDPLILAALEERWAKLAPPDEMARRAAEARGVVAESEMRDAIRAALRTGQED